ncbi:MAG: hypothetical protein VZT48_00445 [Bulleidia sp.]|nr:hypothetical protein [Bulleidia sp.]
MITMIQTNGADVPGHLPFSRNKEELQEKLDDFFNDRISLNDLSQIDLHMISRYLEISAGEEEKRSIA